MSKRSINLLIEDIQEAIDKIRSLHRGHEPRLV